MRSWVCWGLVLILTGCASAPRVVMSYPVQGQPPDLHEQDKRSCDLWAKYESRSDPGAGAVAGAIVGGVLGAAAGAVLGVVTGAFFGQAGQGAAMGAALGGSMGGVRGAYAGAGGQQMTYLNAYRLCMGSRGYAVQ